MKQKKILPFFVLILTFLFSCNPVKKLAEQEFLLNKNIVKCNKSKLNNEIESIIKQKPNRKILGFRFNLHVYNQFNFGKETGLKSWFKRTIGEPPVLLDTALTSRSSRQIKQFMHNIGYFDAEVKDTTIYPSKQKANVKYQIITHEPYTFFKIAYSIKNPVIDSIVKANSQNTLIKQGDNYDTGILQKERERITSLLRDTGFYFFNQQYISFKIDSSLNSHQVNILMSIIDPLLNTNDTLVNDEIRTHKQFEINKIFINTDFDPLKLNAISTSDTVIYNDYSFLFASRFHNYRPSSLADHIFFKSRELYRYSNHENTYSSLSDLGNFRFINIRLETDSQSLIKNENKLNCFIHLTPLLKQSYKIELEGTFNGGNLGAAGNFIYANKNTFKGAENFELKIKTSFENLNNTSVPEEKKFLIFNTYEIGPQLELSIPRMVWPLKKFFPRNTATKFLFSYDVQQRPEFFRRISTFSAGAVFRLSNKMRLLAYPAEINYVDVTLDPDFAEELEEINDPALTASYEDHLIQSGRYSLIYSTQQLNKLKNFLYLRINFELAGNVIRLIDESTGRVVENDSSYEIGDIAYSNYIKPDADFRYYQVVNNKNNLVYRLQAGIGFPYWNSKSLPFEKSFFAGGANDLRAFQAQTVGPGSYNQEQNIQQQGEIKLNGNVEYRFDIFKILQGALFVDAGNIWLTSEDPNRPGGKFEFNRFYKEFAMGGGVGFRLNFIFFIFRVDLGYRFTDPSLPEKERWVLRDFDLFDPSVTNIGIGYPF